MLIFCTLHIVHTINLQLTVLQSLYYGLCDVMCLLKHIISIIIMIDRGQYMSTENYTEHLNHTTGC